MLCPDLVVVLFDEASQRKAKPFVWSDAPIHAVHSPWRVVLVDFLQYKVSIVKDHTLCVLLFANKIKDLPSASRVEEQRTQQAPLT